VTMPNLLLVGAAKAATSSLHSWLGQHPSVFMSANKEPRFFVFEGRRPAYPGPGDAEGTANTVTTEAEYRALFAPGADRPVRGESSTLYLHDPGAAARIRARLPEARIVAVLRDPVERAFSSWVHLKRDRREPLATFEESLAVEPSRRDWDLLWQLVEAGMYGRDLGRYLDLFPADRVQVFVYEEMVRDPRATCREIFRACGVDDGFAIDASRVVNPSWVPRSEAVAVATTGGGLLRRTARALLPLPARRWIGMRLEAWNRVKPRMDEGTRARLREVFRDDARRLEARLGRRLWPWVSGP
jgi:hypothetical protein